MGKHSKRSNKGSVAGPSARKKSRPSKKQKKIPKAQSVQPGHQSDSGQPEIEHDQAVPRFNTSGLATLPDELLLEVMSYCPPIPLPTKEPQPPIDADAQIERREAQSALSHTCSNLRRLFRPYIWQRIEVVSGMPARKRTRKSGEKVKLADRLFNQELVRQLEIVTIRDPSLAEYVNVINVEIKDYSGNKVLEELARCIGIFPNLHTIKLLALVDSIKSFDTGRIFAKYSYTQIRTAIVSRRAFPLLSSCPGIQTAHSTEVHYSKDEFMRAMLHSSPLLQNLYLDLPLWDLQVIVDAFPEVRTLKLGFGTFRFSDEKATFSLISGFKRLKTLELQPSTLLGSGPVTADTILDWAKEILLDLQKTDREEKLIHMSYSTLSGGLQSISVALPAPKPLQPDK